MSYYLLLINQSARIIFERWYSYFVFYSTKNSIVSLTSHSGISTRPFCNSITQLIDQTVISHVCCII